MAGFFSEHYEVFRRLSEKLNDRADQSPEDADARELIQSALKAISFNREEYDAFVVVSVDQRGNTFLELADGDLDRESLHRLLAVLASFIREATLVRNARSGSEQMVLDHFLGVDRDTEAGDWFGYSVDYIRNVLPFRLLEQKRGEIGQLRADLAKERDDAFAEAEELQARIQGHKDTLGKLESEFNFVGLSHAFQSLLAKKKGDAAGARTIVFILSVALVVLPALMLWKGGLGLSLSWSPAEVSKLVAVLGIEVVVFYFFRVTLRSYLLLRNQVTSLELRLALCQFIEGYIEFAGKAKLSKSADAFRGFESLIFSSLPSDDGSIPATLDGVEQIAKIIESLRKPS